MIFVITFKIIYDALSARTYLSTDTSHSYDSYFVKCVGDRFCN